MTTPVLSIVNDDTEELSFASKSGCAEMPANAHASRNRVPSKRSLRIRKSPAVEYENGEAPGLPQRGMPTDNSRPSSAIAQVRSARSPYAENMPIGQVR